MNVLLANKFFFPAAGTETVVLETRRLLTEAGHVVTPFAMAHPNSAKEAHAEFFARTRDYGAGGPIRRLRDGLASVYSFEAKSQLHRLLKVGDKPDVAHLHNVYHQLTLSILDELSAARVPIVMTLHDYKVVCPNYKLLARDGLCERCLGGNFLNAVRYRCVKDSYAGSTLAAIEASINRIRRQYDKVDLFVVPSEFLAGLLGRVGVAGDRVRVVPNPVHAGVLSREATETSSFVYVGRLAPEKGIEVLLDCAQNLPQGTRVVICGDGPLRPYVEHRVRDEELPVELRGYLPSDAVTSEIRAARALVVPSIWYENCPLVILEAAAQGVPTVGTSLGGIPELVEDDETGLLVEAGDPRSLAEALTRLVENPALAATLGVNARARVMQRHSPSRFLAQTLEAYELAIARHGPAGGRC